MNPKDLAAQSRAPLHLLPAATSIHGAMACRDGAIKYGPYNWREKPISLMEYLGALERHIARLKDGQWIDDKSGATHLGHIIATCGILLDAEHVNTLKLDWPNVRGRATQLLDHIESELFDKVGDYHTEEERGGVAGPDPTPLTTEEWVALPLRQRDEWEWAQTDYGEGYVRKTDPLPGIDRYRYFLRNDIDWKAFLREPDQVKRNWVAYVDIGIQTALAECEWEEVEDLLKHGWKPGLSFCGWVSAVPEKEEK